MCSILQNKILTKKQNLVSIDFPFYDNFDKNCFSFTQE